MQLEQKRHGQSDRVSGSDQGLTHPLVNQPDEVSENEARYRKMSVLAIASVEKPLINGE